MEDNKVVKVTRLESGAVRIEARSIAGIFDNVEQAHTWLGARNYVKLADPEQVGEGDHISGVYARLGK